MIRYLAVGNSFSDDALEFLPRILRSANVECEVKNLYIGGCSLELHLQNLTGNAPAYDLRTMGDRTESLPGAAISETLRSAPWNVISFQQASHFSGKPETYAPLKPLMDGVLAECRPDVKTFWHMTWAYRFDSNHRHFPDYGCDQMKMLRSIFDAVRTRVLPLGLPVAPSGTAIQNARTSFIGDNLTRDGFHLSFDFGRFIAGLTVACHLTGADPTDFTFTPDGVDPLRRRVADESVRNAIRSPFEVTQSVFTADKLPF